MALFVDLGGAKRPSAHVSVTAGSLREVWRRCCAIGDRLKALITQTIPPGAAIGLTQRLEETTLANAEIDKGQCMAKAE